jgi:predicted  nucleic acid-binding Zn ribbon protein
MISIALQYIVSKLKAREKSKCCPTKINWKVAKEIYDRWKLLFDITESLSDRKYPTTNIFPLK